jgi:hypothetical protein
MHNIAISTTKNTVKNYQVALVSKIATNNPKQGHTDKVPG